MSGKPQLKGILVPAVLIGILFLVTLILPPLGAIAGIFSPTLLVFVYLQSGRPIGLILVGVVFFVLLVMMGTGPAILFFVEYAILALILGETIRLGFPFDRCILFSALGSAVLSTFFLFTTLSEKDASVTEFFQTQINRHFEQSMKTLESMGESQEELGVMREFAEKSFQTLANAYPAFIVVGSLMAAAGNYFLVQFIWGRLYGPSTFFSGRFSEWVLPEYFIWPLILSGGLIFLGPTTTPGAIGMNVFIVTMVIYFFQGLSVAVHFLESKNVPVFLWIFIFILIVFQPMLMGLVIGLGIFDIWLDFRKIKIKPTETPET